MAAVRGRVGAYKNHVDPDDKVDAWIISVLTSPKSLQTRTEPEKT